MSSERIAFAIEQRTLDPIHQLALIIASDCCGDAFTLDQFCLSITMHTSLSERECIEAFNYLSKAEIIFLSHATEFGSPYYYILAEQS